jgi:hypothetical protein
MIMEAPDKIYLIRNLSTSTSLNTTNDCHYKYLQEWYKGREKDTDIEYIRTDVFIEKAVEWLEPVLTNYAGYYVGNDILSDFKNYMEQ